MSDKISNVAVGDIILKYPHTGPQHDQDRPHYMVVAIIADTEAFIVPICSAKRGLDRTCLIEPHQLRGLIKHQSLANYLRTKITPLAAIRSLLSSGHITLRFRDRDSIALAKKIADGFYVSRKVTPLMRARLPERKRDCAWSFRPVLRAAE